MAEQRRIVGNSGVPELRLECVDEDHLWNWHLVFGFPEAMNDLNILERSPRFSKVRD